MSSMCQAQILRMLHLHQAFRSLDRQSLRRESQVEVVAGLGEVMDTGEEAMLVVEEVMDLGAVVVVAAVAVAVCVCGWVGW